jgi:hypothetical protein
MKYENKDRLFEIFRELHFLETDLERLNKESLTDINFTINIQTKTQYSNMYTNHSLEGMYENLFDKKEVVYKIVNGIESKIEILKEELKKL